VARRPSRNCKVAGALLSLAGAAILMGFVTAEALYPGVYTTHTNTVSHLGASEPPHSVVLQPSAAIFDITMLVTGAMIVVGAWFAYRALRRKAVLIPTALLGVGTFGVGVFPLTHPALHTLFAFTAFLAGGIAVVLSSRVTTAPFRYLWTTLGAIALGATVLALDAFRGWAPLVELGEGGLGALDRVPDRPVARGLRQLPAGGCQPDRRSELCRRWCRLTCRTGSMPNQGNQGSRGAPWP
jgi:hypothetical membrane protein